MSVNKIMMICTGNISRSPMAEYLFKNDQYVAEKKVTVISAGLGALVGSSADPIVRKLLDEQGIDCQGHIAQQVTDQMVNDMDLILVMEQHHRKDMLQRFPQSRAKLFLMRHQDQLDIIDPYKKDMAVFKQIQEDIKIGMNQWVSTLVSF